MIGIAFDLTGTLVEKDDLEHEAFMTLLARLSSEHHQTFDSQLAVAAADRLVAARIADPAGWQSCLASETSAILGRPSRTAVLAARYRQIAAALVPEVTRIMPGVRETLQRLASLRIPCAILTNGSSAIEQRRAKWAGFDGPVLVAEDVGAWKPARPAFDALVTTLALPPDRIWYVGDDPEVDVNGAARAGLRTVWIRPPGTAYPANLVAPDHEIERIDDVWAILSEPYTRSLLGLRYILHGALSWRRGHYLPGTEYGLNDPPPAIDVPPRQSDDG